MKLKQTRLHILHNEENLSNKAKTGVSLHCHTQFSREMLDFIPHYAEQMPIISYFWKKEQENFFKKEGKKIDFSTAYWSPPMSENMVYQLETEQLNKAGLDAIVSITDHDCIDANLKICQTIPNEKAPISMEWTVPFEYGFFHLGVHNLPKDRADEIAKHLLDFTFAAERELKVENIRLTELFAMLNAIPEVLIVFNHPVWDIEIVGKERHTTLLKKFIKEYGQWIHALEINGFRSWSENKEVIEMAEALGMPLVTGGDRHGCRPNTMINLTNSQTFAEFTNEIRVDKLSEVVLLPKYKQPLVSRYLQSFSDILGYYPEFPEGRQKWFERIFYDMQDDKGLQPLSAHWKYGGPTWLRWTISILSLLGNDKLRPFFQLAVNRKDVVPKDENATDFVIPNMDEIISGNSKSSKRDFPSLRPRYD